MIRINPKRFLKYDSFGRAMCYYEPNIVPFNRIWLYKHDYRKNTGARFKKEGSNGTNEISSQR